MSANSPLQGAGVAFSQKLFGSPTRLQRNPDTATVGTSATQLLRNNPTRIAWIIVNNGASPVFLDFSNVVALNTGITLAASGGLFSISASDFGELPTYEVWAINSVGGVTVSVYEVTED